MLIGLVHVPLMKEIIVVRTGAVLMGNIASNATYLCNKS